jgi:hypothetical protein
MFISPHDACGAGNRENQAGARLLELAGLLELQRVVRARAQHQHQLAQLGHRRLGLATLPPGHRRGVHADVVGQLLLGLLRGRATRRQPVAELDPHRCGCLAGYAGRTGHKRQTRQI